jgi:hypothetical protein
LEAKSKIKTTKREKILLFEFKSERERERERERENVRFHQSIKIGLVQSSIDKIIKVHQADKDIGHF